MRESVRHVAPFFLILILFLAGVSCLPVRGDEGADVTREANPAPSGAMSGCSICHVDVEIESKSSRHVAEGIGCVDCHGASEGHILDENNDVKPDRVFSRADSVSLCNRCHGCSLPAKNRPPPKVSTDCHDAHAAGIPAK